LPGIGCRGAQRGGSDQRGVLAARERDLDIAETILAVLFGIVCFCAVVMSSSNGMLTAIADGVLARESRETPLSKAVTLQADHLQVSLSTHDCGDSRKGSTVCNKTGNKLEQADEKLVSEHEHIEEAADPQAKIAEQWFGATPIQAHTARVLR
jgi:hypothetical protein